MQERDLSRSDYWRNVAFSGEPGKLVLPDGTGSFMPFDSDLETFIHDELLRGLEEVQGDVMDIGGGGLTRSLFPALWAKGRKVIGVDISEEALHTPERLHPNYDPDTRVPLDRAIVADLEEERLSELGIAYGSIALATMLRVWRYLSCGALADIVQDTYELLAPGGEFIVADFFELSFADEIRKQMGERRCFDDEEATKAVWMFQAAGFEKVVTREIGERVGYRIVIGRKPKPPVAKPSFLQNLDLRRIFRS